MRTTLGMVSVATALLLAASFANVSAQPKQTAPRWPAPKLRMRLAARAGATADGWGPAGRRRPVALRRPRNSGRLKARPAASGPLADVRGF